MLGIYILGHGMAFWLRHCATSRTVPGSIPGVVTGNFFRDSHWRNHVPWGRFSLWKWVPGISPGVKAASDYGWRPTTLVVPNVKKILGLNLPGTPWATSAFAGLPLPLPFTNILNLKKNRKHIQPSRRKIHEPIVPTTLSLSYSLSEFRVLK